MDFVGRVFRLVDEPRVANHRFELENAPFDKRLLLLGVFVLRVFAQIAVLFGLANAVVDFFAVDRFELVELVSRAFESPSAVRTISLSFNYRPSQGVPRAPQRPESP